MTNESPHGVGASERSGGPAAATTVAHTPTRYTPLDCCVENVLVWSLLAGEIPVPNTPAWRALADLAEALALRTLRAIAPVLEHSNMWASVGNRYVERHDTYDTPPKSAAQIRAEVRHSHAKWEREIAARWAA